VEEKRASAVLNRRNSGGKDNIAVHNVIAHLYKVDRDMSVVFVRVCVTGTGP
jgi:hypothetical protein